MNKQGQMTLGVMLTMVIAVLVAVTIFSSAIIPQIGESTTTATIVNQTLDTETDGYEILNGRAVNQVLYVYNATGVLNASGCSPAAPLTTSCFLTAGNYTILSNQLNPTTGVLEARYQPNANGFNATAGVNITYVTQPLSYVPDSGARAITGLIAVFAALAIAVVALLPVMRNKF
jgi:hypothetical protein